MSDSAPPPPPQDPNASAAPPPPPPPMPIPASAPPPPGMAAGPRPGSLLDRFLARFIDGILIGIVYVIVSIVVGVALNGGFVAAAILAVIEAVLYLAYFAYLESTRGQTFGKQIMKLHVVGPDGVSHPTMEQAVRRNVWVAFGILGIVPILGSIIGGLGELVAVIVIAVTINGDALKRQSWFDHFAGGTQVIKQG